MKALLGVPMLLAAAFFALPGNSEERLPTPREYREPLPMPLEVSSAVEPTLTVSGPHAHANLQIFLLHAKDQVDTRKILTLAEAMEQKKIVVHETSEVNLLSVENTSDDIDVFIQTGDIVKGGKQDRIMAFDMLVPAKSGKLPIPSFCCESGRWQKRGEEDDGRFGLSTANANGKDFKLAVQSRLRGGQSEVWDKVHAAQLKLAEKVGKPVAAEESRSSLQLTLENKQLIAKLEAYEKALAKILDGESDVVGFALAINGKVEGAEVFGSAALFKKIWPRLLNAAAVDALSNLEKDKKYEPSSTNDVQRFLTEANAAKGTEMRLVSEERRGRGYGARANVQDIQGRIPAQASDIDGTTPVATRLKLFQRDTGKTVTVESQERGAILHRSYTAR